MNSDELRSAFLKFFEEKGHKVIPGSSLVPKNDPTLLLTNAGMVQVKPYFLGEAKPPSKRLASCQKCFRTTDIEEVGDATHLTFFEMLGNFSVGEYFKKEAIAWAWEFVTERMKIPTEKLWITIYLDDDESFKLWREIGIPENKIVRFGEEDNFWGPAGSSGPCGPCSEIHYDFGVEYGCGKPDCQPNCECGRFTELWNLVFTQYNQDEKGKRTPLPNPNIDTGMGLERLTAITSGKSTIYDSGIFTTLLDCVAEISGRKYGANPDDDISMRVVAEHGRALAFLVADGVLPDNEGRGYILRRLLRRATLYGMRIGLDKPFLSEIAQVAIKEMHRIYPELKQRSDYIKKVIQQEETGFGETMRRGIEKLQEYISAMKTNLRNYVKKREHGGVYPEAPYVNPEYLKEARENPNSTAFLGKWVFNLYDTYGFPIELTQEIVAKEGFSVDMPGFEKEMAKQRDRARASHKFDIEIKDSIKLTDVTGTDFVGYTCLDQQAKVIKLLVDGKEVDEIKNGQSAGIVLDTSPFYAEMGGQVGDTGEIIGKNGKFTVTDTVAIPPDVNLHQGKIPSGSIKVGESVRAVVDIERRRDIARNHTATHLLQAALRQVLGEHIQQRGSLVAPEHLRFDFSHLAAMTREEIKSVQHIVNEKIRQNLAVTDEQTDYKKAIAAGAIALFDEKYGDVVRVMRIGDPVVSTELCGGTHVAFTGEIGYFHIISESSIGAGIRRIEALTGRGAEAFIEDKFEKMDSVLKKLKTASDNVMERIDQLLYDMEDKNRHSLWLERELAKMEAENLFQSKEKVNGIQIVVGKISSESNLILREMADFLRDRLQSGIVVLGAVIADRPIFVVAVTPDLVTKGYNAGDIIKKVSQVAGGGGGGKPGFAQAGGKDKNKLDEALRLVKSLI